LFYLQRIEYNNNVYYILMNKLIIKKLYYSRHAKILIGTVSGLSMISGLFCGYIFNKIELLVKSK